jgi:predicted helicase
MNRIETIRDPSAKSDDLKKALGIEDTGSWSLEKAQEKILADKDWTKKIVQVSFRPFDVRWLFYDKDFVDRPRTEVMRHMSDANIGLNAMRQFAYNVSTYNYALVTDKITDSRIFISNKGAAYFFPLYLHEHTESGLVKRPNLNAKLIPSLEEAYHRTVLPEEVLFYVYAVLYSEKYRKKYFQFFQTDYPRIPFTAGAQQFAEMAEFGKKLVDLHLLRLHHSSANVRFIGEGSSVVDDIEYDENSEHLQINDSQYFDSVKKAVWEYGIGGYQVLFKWIKDRKDSTLSLEDIKHFCIICGILEETITLQTKIDELYPVIEEETLALDIPGFSTLGDYLDARDSVS